MSKPRKFFLDEYPKIKREFDLQRRNLEQFETFDKAKEARDKLIRRLRKGGHEHQKLAKKLSRCKKGRRCWSGACPVCMRRFRRWFASQALSIIKEQDAPLLVTFVPSKVDLKRGQLLTLDVRKMIENLRKRLAHTDVANVIVLGAVDISFNVSDNNHDDGYWQPHFHVVATGVSKHTLKTVLDPIYNREDNTPRPLKIKHVRENLPRTILYTFKPGFSRRSRFKKLEGGPGTKTLPLKPPEVREAALFADSISITDRQFLRNIRRHGQQLIVRRNFGDNDND